MVEGAELLDVLQRWLVDDQMELTNHFRRDTIIAAMKAQIEKGCEDLDWFNFVTNEAHAELEADENFHYYSLDPQAFELLLLDLVQFW